VNSEPVAFGEGNILQHFWYLFAAYMVIWTAIFLYVLSLARKNRELRDELQVLQNRVEQLKAERET
jgi:CcmD family protein